MWRLFHGLMLVDWGAALNTPESIGAVGSVCLQCPQAHVRIRNAANLTSGGWFDKLDPYAILRFRGSKEDMRTANGRESQVYSGAIWSPFLNPPCPSTNSIEPPGDVVETWEILRIYTFHGEKKGQGEGKHFIVWI